MNYFYDTEFIENGSTIDLISIGMIAEDGREYYAVSRQFDLLAVLRSPWLVEHVLPSLPYRKIDPRSGWSLDNFEGDLTKDPWRWRHEIANDLVDFIGTDEDPRFWGYYSAYDHVALSQLYGTMVELPRNFPMWTMDLKQLIFMLGDPHVAPQTSGTHNALEDARWVKHTFETLGHRYRLNVHRVG